MHIDELFKHADKALELAYAVLHDAMPDQYIPDPRTCGVEVSLVNQDLTLGVGVKYNYKMRKSSAILLALMAGTMAEYYKLIYPAYSGGPMLQFGCTEEAQFDDGRKETTTYFSITAHDADHRIVFANFGDTSLH